ncbi:MAG: hypothetical protein ACQEQ4_05430 [Fibrobacterota bacterium]
MKLVIIHYHLRMGGVTGVIISQVQALQKFFPHIDVEIIAGDIPTSVRKKLDCPLFEVPECDYYDEGNRDIDRIRNTLSTLLASYPFDTLFHVHNPSIGKNPALTAAVTEYARRGGRCIFHCHDFIEERPALLKTARQLSTVLGYDTYTNYFYPQTSFVQWIFLNRADMNRPQFHRVQNQCFYVPNPVQLPPKPRADRRETACKIGADPDTSWFVYPVRAIERKNIGECILLSRLLAPNDQWIIMRAPENSREMPLYKKWTDLARSFDLPFIFDAAKHIPFSHIYHHADTVVTTSFREGFGMAFLEPYYIGKKLVGRDLPEITRDFTALGISFPGLYTALWVSHGNSTCDFALLSPQEKLCCVRDILSRDKKHAEFIHLNQNTRKKLLLSTDETEGNQDIVHSRFSPEIFSRRLYRIYTK